MHTALRLRKGQGPEHSGLVVVRRHIQALRPDLQAPPVWATLQGRVPGEMPSRLQQFPGGPAGFRCRGGGGGGPPPEAHVHPSGSSL
eukprot:1478153-Alexandrium_andersonii.AAC.1